MRKKILKKAKEMNYKPNKLAQGLARGTKTIGFIIPHYPMNFIRYVENGIKARINELNDYNIKGIVKQPMTSQETVLAAKELIGANVDGIILLSNQVVPGISEVLKETGVKDLPIAAIVSEPMDGTPIVGTVRSNGQILGSMAAQFLSMCVDNSKLFAVLIPEEDAVIHTKCYESFLRESMSRGMHSTMLFKSSLGKDKDNYKIAEEIIEQNKNIGGIYVASNNAVGVCKYLEDADRKDITVIGHDLYPELAQCIEKGSLKATLFRISTCRQNRQLTSWSDTSRVRIKTSVQGF